MCSFRQLLPWLVVIGIALFVLFTFLFNPAENVFAPKCVVKSLTGYSCPGCGFQRALHALLHGRVMEAVQYNFFLLLAFPYLLALLFSDVLLKGRAQLRWQTITHSPYLLWFYLLAIFFWWVFRNFLGI